MNSIDGKRKFIFCTIIISLVFIIIWSAYSVSNFNGNLIRGKNSSIGIYFILCILFIFAEIVLNRMTKLIELSDKAMFRFTLFAAAVLLAMSIYCFYTEKTLFPAGFSADFLRNNFGLGYFLLLFALAFIIFSEIEQFRLKKCSRIIICSIVSIIMGISQYCPNPFADTLGKLYHFDAYTNSIFNILNLNAYNDVNCSIYGHYGLFYLPIVKLLGGSAIGVSIAIAFFSFISAMAISLTINKLIKNDVVFLLTALSIPSAAVMVFKTGTYAQIIPHRYLFPSILIFWCTIFISDRCKKWAEYAGWIICCLSIVWNTETGIICTLAFSAYCGYRLILSKGWNYSIFFIPLKIVTCFIASLGIVNIYNIFVGGSINNVKDFIYPMMSKTYDINALIAGVPKGPQFYILEIIIFLIPISIAFLNLRKSNCKEVSTKSEVMLLSGMLGLGCFTYYINRAAYGNIVISHLELLIIVGIFCDYGYRKTDDSSAVLTKSEKILSKLSIILLICFTLGTVTYTGINLYIKQNTSWNMSELNKGLNEIKNEVPKDTYSYGPGVPIIYGLLGWDKQCFATDLEDFNDISLRHIDNDLLNQDSCFMNVQAAWLSFKNLAAFDVKKTFTIGNETFLFYQRREGSKGEEK